IPVLTPGETLLTYPPPYGTVNRTLCRPDSRDKPVLRSNRSAGVVGTDFLRQGDDLLLLQSRLANFRFYRVGQTAAGSGARQRPSGSGRSGRAIGVYPQEEGQEKGAAGRLGERGFKPEGRP